MYHLPLTLDEAVSILAQGAPQIRAGCTDAYPAQRQGQAPGAILDLTRVVGLRGITQGPQGWRIGATTTWTDILRAELPPAFDALKQAARQVGSVQIQNRATIAGNLCNASPAADGVPPLMVLDAQVELTGPLGVRVLPLAQFITGPRQTARAADEVVSAVLVPPVSGTSAFEKLGSRAHLVISIAMVAVRVTAQAGAVQSAAVAVGSCAPVARRLPMLDAALVGWAPGAPMPEGSALYAPLSPIDDVRGSAAYRRDVVPELIRRALVTALEGTA